MPTSLTFDEHLAALEWAGTRLVTLATDAGMEAPVPTCPTWRADSLIAHQAMVHRWATAHVRGENPDEMSDEAAIGSSVTDLPAHYRAGLDRLTESLRHAPIDLHAMTFLDDAPPPRSFWARRQAHETTIHMVDALAANLGRVPLAAEAAIDPALAADGIDELLRGFFTRGRSKLYDGSSETIAVAPDDVDRCWILHVAERLTVEPGDPPVPRDGGTTTLTGSAAQLYVALWNRGDEVAVHGRTDVLERWRATQRVGWS